MIVIVAPYSPVGSCDVPHLGAARKIEAVVGILSRRDKSIILVNTAHHSILKSSLSISKINISGVEVVEVTPPISTSRRFGKFANIFDVSSVIQAVLKLGSVNLVWLYNGYAFESSFGKKIHKLIGCPVILEMEDWHFSRGRGLNPKPYADWLCWRALMPSLSYAFAVNKNLAEKMQCLGSSVGLFPGIVANDISNLNEQFPPFSGDEKSCVVGYFGGLSVEKGADQVAALISKIPENYKIIVTGSGELEGLFRQLHGNKLEFHGRVDNEGLVKLIGSCDVVLNPHTPIDSMSNGIFPFKVIEGIASGRLLISTHLPSAGLENVLQGVDFIGHDFEQLLHSIKNARSTYMNNKQAINDGAKSAFELFGMDAILSTVNRVIRVSK